MKFIKKDIAETRTIYDFEEENKKGEKLSVEIMKMYDDNKYKDSLPNIWKKHGYTNKLYNSRLCVTCFVTDKDGNCWERYNPTIKLSDDKKRYIINFDWLFEVSDENIDILLNEIYKRFMEVK